ncbi:hypothetical protein BED35_18190 [Yersinia enterocolitica]|uniref:hypothetical protein n=1 Tax=Yersinia enterocolitica TaxID=630 RepID=UPI00083D1D32|nr:hypothetical protein [Yersinia enterocolitica]AOF20170.1 hypothetical protein BED34_17725 [Yersinia enterocolitica]AOF24705.1 hypothetical protein BED33_20420 [Yersinia enterocolitica]AOF28346.1 hypothetical protein BED32_17330 [Yersinia enterocolitica]AOF32521.1 hypothetical protein BED35_18190 [Yersinia enterocolitica]AOF36441.1 hypothetical protein BFS78_17275 [Yersinia enterocolitica]
MSVNIQAAVLTNMVKWKSDVQSMKKVRDDMKRLKKEAAGILDNSISPRSAAHGVKLAKQSAQAQVSAMKKVYGSAGAKGGLVLGYWANRQKTGYRRRWRRLKQWNRQAKHDKHKLRQPERQLMLRSVVYS